MERAVAAIRGYYHNLNGRFSVKDALVDFANYIKCILKGLGKLYPSAQHRRLPLLANYMRSIRAIMNLGLYSEAALWVVWLSQWNAVMRGSDIMRAAD